MRINLQCPYSEKDQAKALGARWDPARKVWYIVDVEDLTPFMRWITVSPKESPTRAVSLSKRVFPAKTPKHTGVFVPLCDCDVLPWDDCEHTEALAQAALREHYGITPSA